MSTAQRFAGSDNLGKPPAVCVTPQDVVLVVDEICLSCVEPGQVRARTRGRVVCMEKHIGKSADWRVENGAREDAVRGGASDEGLEDFGTEEGAVGEDVVRGWGQEFEIEAGGDHGCG